MAINLTNYGSWYIEILTKNEIRINSTMNDCGSLMGDQNGNIISNTQLGCGRKDIVEMISNTNGNIILYNEGGDYFNYIDSTFDEADDEYYYMLDMYGYNKYRLGADKVETVDVTGNTINIDLTNKDVFKVIMNDKDVKNYTKTSSSITLTDGDEDYIKSYNNRAIVYTYIGADQCSVSGESIFKYHSPVKFFSYKRDEYSNGSFFKDMIPFCEFNSFNLNTSNTLRDVKRAYKRNERQRQTDRSITLDISSREDLRNIVGDNYFRMIAWSEDNDRLTIINDCLLQEGATRSFTTSGANETSFNIGVGSYIELNYIYGRFLGYGLDPYGSSAYGSFKIDLNDYNNIKREEVNQ